MASMLLKNRWRSVVNIVNATALSHVTGSVVVSGYPKTGTTYLSHLAEQATGKPYIEGSMRFAVRPSVIHTHYKRIPASAIYSFRPIEKVIASFVTHRMLDLDRSFGERARNNAMTEGDKTRLRRIGHALLSGSWRLQAPSVYYADVSRRDGTIVNVLDLGNRDSIAHHRLRDALGLSPDALDQAIAAAAALSEVRRKDGHEFYNRPTERVREMIDADAQLSDMVREEARLTQAIIDGATGV